MPETTETKDKLIVWSGMEIDLPATIENMTARYTTAGVKPHEAQVLAAGNIILTLKDIHANREYTEFVRGVLATWLFEAGTLSYENPEAN